MLKTTVFSGVESVSIDVFRSTSKGDAGGTCLGTWCPNSFGGFGVWFLGHTLRCLKGYSWLSIQKLLRVMLGDHMGCGVLNPDARKSPPNPRCATALTSQGYLPKTEVLQL